MTVRCPSCQQDYALLETCYVVLAHWENDDGTLVSYTDEGVCPPCAARLTRGSAREEPHAECCPCPRCLACPFCGRPGDGLPCAPACPPRETRR